MQRRTFSAFRCQQRRSSVLTPGITHLDQLITYISPEIYIFLVIEAAELFPEKVSSPAILLINAFRRCARAPPDEHRLRYSKKERAISNVCAVPWSEYIAMKCKLCLVHVTLHLYYAHEWLWCKRQVEKLEKNTEMCERCLLLNFIRFQACRELVRYSKSSRENKKEGTSRGNFLT